MLYDKGDELENLINGIIDGPLTEAYAEVAVYKNHYRTVEIYVDGYTLNEYIERHSENRSYFSRYKLESFGMYGSFTYDEYVALIEENNGNLEIYENILSYMR